MTTTSINRRSERNQRARDQSRASNDRCASALKKTQLRDGSCDEGHIAIDTTMMMITKIVIGTAMAAEVGRVERDNQRKGDHVAMGERRKRREYDDCRAQRASTRCKSHSQ